MDRPFGKGCICVLASLLLHCSDKGGELTKPPLEVKVDTAVQPVIKELPGPNDTKRPVAAMADARGKLAHFVERELIVATDNDSELNALVQRWGGAVIGTVDLAAAGVPGVPRMHLIQINPSLADTSTLVADLQGKDGKTGGVVRVSSEAGLKAIAAGARELALGGKIGLNWVSEGHSLRDRNIAEAPTGPAGYTPNAFQWSYMARDTGLRTGVAEAWRLLEITNRTNNQVPIAILDNGFDLSRTDYPTNVLALPTVSVIGLPILPGVPSISPCGGGWGGAHCTWHGTFVTLSAMGVPGNSFGAAGPAGTVARPIMVATLGDMFSTIVGLATGATAGARIFNMSYGIPMPAGVSVLNLPSELATVALRASGKLLFASAGNDGDNVDAETCIPLFDICWEDTWHMPCENAGVICVGGTNIDNLNRAPHSNYGSKNSGDTVDIAGPFELYTSHADEGNTAEQIAGTSYSSPFVAGVAAMIWAANPGLSASQVENLLMSKATPLADGGLKRMVNAYAAVLEALGGSVNEPPTIRITGPVSNLTVQVEQTVTFVAQVSDTEDGGSCCNVTWSTNVDGTIGQGKSLTHTFHSAGARVVTATVRDSANNTATDTVTINVGDAPPPTATITTPSGANTVFYRGSQVAFQGVATNPVHGGTLPCTSLAWTATGGSGTDTGFPATGCDFSATFNSNGARQITLTATDSLGHQGTATVSITIVDPPLQLPPNVEISSPAHQAVFADEKTTISLSEAVTDPKGLAIKAYEWTALWFKVPVYLSDKPALNWRPADNGVTCGKVNLKVTITLKATNKGGLSASHSHDIYLTCAPP